MITGDQILAHLFGDYILQSDWMANEKTKKSLAALAHVVAYSVPFLFLTVTLDPFHVRWEALLVIVGTHFAIDRWRLARYVCYAKNFLAPRETSSVDPSRLPTDRPAGVVDISQAIVFQRWWHPWSECSGTGYHKDRPAWMSVWLLIIADNAIHLLINGLALRFLS